MKMELDDIAETISDLLAKKKELRPLGKEIAESLESEQRRKLADALSQMAVDVVPSEYKAITVAPDTQISVPSEVASKNPVTAEDLYNIEWSHDWAQAMYRMATGEEPSKEDIMRILKEKLLPEVKK